MREEDYKLLDRYLQNELSAAEQTAFAERLDSDEAFAAELALRQQMNTYLRTEAQRPDLKKEMTALGQEYFETTDTAKVVSLGKRRRYIGLSIAAAIALILLIWNPFSSGSLYQQYAQHPPLALVEKGAALTLAQEAEVAYRAEDYEKAYTLLNELTDLSSANTQLQLALGISALETGRTTKARQLFEELANGNSALRNYGQWYLALSYLKTEETNQAKIELEKLDTSDPALRAKADQLLEEL